MLESNATTIWPFDDLFETYEYTQQDLAVYADQGRGEQVEEAALN